MSDEAGTDKGERTIEAPAYASFIGRSIRALGERSGAADPIVAASQFAELRAALDRAEHAALTRWLEDGYTYRYIADAYGVAHNAVIQRYRRLSEGAA